MQLLSKIPGSFEDLKDTVTQTLKSILLLLLLQRKAKPGQQTSLEDVHVALTLLSSKYSSHGSFSPLRGNTHPQSTRTPHVLKGNKTSPHAGAAEGLNGQFSGHQFHQEA